MNKKPCLELKNSPRNLVHSVRHYTQISRNEYLLLIITLYIDLSTPGQHGGLGYQRRIGTDEYLQVAPEKRKLNSAIDCVKMLNIYISHVLSMKTKCEAINFPDVCLYASLVLRFNDSVLWGDGKAVSWPGQLKAQLSV